MASLLVVFSGGMTISTFYAAKARQRATEATTRAIEAEIARMDATKRLYESLQSQAEAGLTSGQIGQRLNTLRIIREAVAIRRSPELRDLAISALALPDVETLRQIPLPDCTVIHGFDRQLRRVAISVDEGRGIEVWDTFTNTRLRTVSAMGTRHDGQLSPDGRWLVDSSDSSNVTRVWDVDSQAGPVRTLATSERNRVSFDPPGQLAAVNGNGRIVIYKVEDWTEQRTLSSGEAVQVCFRPGRPEIAWIAGRTITVVRLSDGVPVITLDLKSTPSPYSTFAWHPDGTRIAVNSSRKLHLWDVDRRVEIGEVPGDTSGGDTIAFTPEGDALMSTGWNGTVRFHETHPFRQRFVLNEVYTDYTPFFIGRGGEFTRQLVTGRKAPVSRYIRGREFATYETIGAETNISSVLHPSGRWWAMGIVETGEIELHAIDGRSIARVPIDDAGGLLFDAAGNLFTSTRSGLYRWPVRCDPASCWTIGPPDRQPSFDSRIFALSAGGQRVLRHSSEGQWTVHSVKPPHGRVALGSQGHHKLANLNTDGRVAALSPDGRFAVTSVTGDSEFVAWDTRTGRPLKRFKAATSAQLIPTFSPDGRRLLLSLWWGATSRGSPLGLYGTDTWEKLRDLGEGYGGVFSPDGTHVAYEEGPGIIRLVATESGKTLARLRHPAGLRGGLSYSADGSRLFAQRMDLRGSYNWNLRAIRERLGELGLDWDAPPLPSETEPTEPLKVTFVGTELLDPNSAACRARRLLAPLLHASQVDLDDDLSQADELARLGWHDLSLAAYSNTIRRHPRLADARLHRGLELFRHGKWEAAAEDFRAHLKDDPDCAHRAECQTRLAWSLHERGRYADAAAELTDLVERPPPSWKRAHRAAVLLLRAEFLDRAGESDAAEADRDRAADATSNLAKAANERRVGLADTEAGPDARGELAARPGGADSRPQGRRARP